MNNGTTGYAIVGHADHSRNLWVLSYPHPLTGELVTKHGGEPAPPKPTFSYVVKPARTGEIT